MFAGRQNELRKLYGFYSSSKFECVVVHGRPRVGKTALLCEFTSEKKSIYFAANETSGRENLENLARCLMAFQLEYQYQTQEINEYEEAFGLAFKLAQSERIILVLDNYDYLVSAQRGISALIRSCIDKWQGSSKLMLIICGPSGPVLDRQALGYDSPLHGRRTAQINLLPFNFFETKRYYGAFSSFDIAVIYGVTGGVPKYLELMDPELPIEENIQRAFFNTSSLLFEEPANLLRREVRDPAYYNAVLRAIASGCSKNSEIATAVGLETSACTAYLKNLTALGYISKHTPVTEKAGKKTIYEIEDSMFRFWYRFVPGYLSLIQCGMAGKIWRNVAREIPLYMSQIFEDICRQWVELRNSANRLPTYYVEVGRWWGVDPVLKTDISLPIVAYADEAHALFGDCVWSDDPAGDDALASLEERSRIFRYPNRRLYLFSRSGFSDKCIKLAQHLGANLIMFE